MASKIYEENDIRAIANAIREKNGGNATYKTRDMANAIRAIVAGVQGVDIQYSQVQPNVQSFITAARAAYSMSDYTNSVVGNYVGYAQQYAKPLSSVLQASAGELEIVDGNTGVVTKKTVDGTPVQIKNISPSDSFYVVKKNGDVVQAGTITPTGALRMIDTVAMNVRDLGGWACDGGTIKYGMLFRGGEIGASDIPTLVDECGVRAELNLRGQEEAGRTESPLGADIAFCCPKDYVWYTITDSRSDAWREILRFVFDNAKNGIPTYFHCAAGADRTGTVACILEAILGVSQTDCDIDYELTTFHTGNQTDETARRRNESDWTGLIGQITAKTGATFRDKVINWVATLGFTVDEINHFRRDMIDGTPQDITLGIPNATITKAVSHATVDNGETSKPYYQPYSTKIKADNGYVIESVFVSMNGEPITSGVWKGEKTTLNVAVTNNLTNCSTNNSKIAIIKGQSYGARITPNIEYTLEDAEISITMGGVDVSTYYSNGYITIPNVTGDIVITVNAVPSASAFTNQVPISTDTDGSIYNGVGYMNNKRLNSSGNVSDATIPTILTGFIPCKSGDRIYIGGTCGIKAINDASLNNFAYTANKVKIDGCAINMAFHYNNPTTYHGQLEQSEPYEWDSVNKELHYFTIPNNTNVAYIRLTLAGTDGEGAIVTVNEPIE